MATGSPRIVCDSIELRLTTPHAAPSLLRLAGDAHLTRYMRWRPHLDIDASLGWISDTQRLWEQRRAFMPGIFEREHERLIGAIGVHGIDVIDRCAEVGTWIGIPHQGQGFNLLAKAALFAWCFEALQLERLEMLVRTDNAQSVRSMQKLPQVQMEGVQRSRLWTNDGPADVQMWSITRRDWDPALWPAVEFHGVDLDASLLDFPE